MPQTSNPSLLKVALLTVLLTAGSACSTAPNVAPPAAGAAGSANAAASTNTKKAQDPAAEAKTQPKAALAAKPICPVTTKPNTGAAPAGGLAAQGAALTDPTGVAAPAASSGATAGADSTGQLDANGCPVIAAVPPALVLPQADAPAAQKAETSINKVVRGR